MRNEGVCVCVCVVKLAARMNWAVYKGRTTASVLTMTTAMYVAFCFFSLCRDVLYVDIRVSNRQPGIKSL